MQPKSSRSSRSSRFRAFIVAALALVTAAAVTLPASPPAVAAGIGTHRRGVPSTASRWSMTERFDAARISLLASKMVQDFARELFRTAEGTYQSGCFSNGFLCAAGTGFNVNVGAGTCYLNYATGADADESAYRVLRLEAAEAATDWDANPGADTYYVHVAFGESRSTDGYLIPTPAYTVDTNASLAGTLTVCSIVVGGAEPDATTYTYNDLRTVLAGPYFHPQEQEFAAGLKLGDDTALTFGDDDDFTCDFDSVSSELDCYGGTVDLEALAITGTAVTATATEINAVADLSAVGAIEKICMATADEAGERTAGAHAICTLPAKAIVEDVWISVATQEASGTTTVDIGPAGTADGYANDASVAAPGLIRPQAATTAGGNETYFSSNTRGSLLATFLAGADVAGDVGTYQEHPTSTGSGLVVSYTVPAGGWTEFVGTFYVRYVEVQ